MNTKPYKPYGGRKKRLWLKLLLALVLIAAVVFAALTVYIGINSRTHIAGEPKAMVIFGCQMRSDGPSILLKDRLDTALTYWEEHPDIKIVVTGGKGDDEHLSEAQGMYDYLTAHGVNGANIYKEDQSRTTWENVNNTLDLMGEVGMTLNLTTGEAAGMNPGGSVLLVSNGFHLARIKMLWARAGGHAANISTLAAPVSHAPSAVHMFFREPLALVKSFIFDR